MLPEGYATLKLEAQNDIAIIIDASESAEPYREIVMKTVSQLLDKLPAGYTNKLYYLGNATTYDAMKLSRNAGRWWQENSQRGSFITPNLQSLSACQVIVVGCGKLYDLEDWKGSDRESNLIFITARESLRNGVDIGREFDSSQVPEAITSLHNPVLSVEITGDGFMPFSWDNTDYSVTIDRSASLAAINPKTYSVSVRFFGSNVVARVVRKSGDEEVRLDRAGGVMDAACWSALTHTEATRFVKAIHGEEIDCPVCPETHSSSTLRCDRHTILGEPVYPSLAAHHGFVCFLQTSQGVQFMCLPVPVLKVGQDKVAVAHGNQAAIYEYTGKHEGWKNTGTMPAYHQLDNIYVCLL